MDPIVKKILIAIVIIALVLALIFAVNKAHNKNSKKKGDQNVQDKNNDPNEKEGTTPEEGETAKVITCNYEGEEVNVIWEKSHVIFKINKNNQVLTREDVREYQFDQVNIDEYINNKTLATISKVLNGINGIESSLVPINENEHTYRFSTTFDFKTLNLDDLYNFYYRRFYNNGDINMTREQFDARYKSLDYDAMVKAYLNTGYICS